MPEDVRSEDARKVCLLTGAGGVLGTEFCRRWRSAYRIVAVFRSTPVAVDTQDEWDIDPLGAKRARGPGRDGVFAVRSGLGSRGELERVVDLGLARFGRIDVLINAAVHVRRDRLTSLASATDFLDDALSVNAALPIHLASVLCRRAWLHRRAENEAWGRNVVNLSSMASLGVVPGVGLSAYSASKAALNMLTAHLAVEFSAIGVRVNGVAPTSFPRLVGTAAVTDAIVDLDRSDLTGTLVEVDERGTRYRPLVVR